MIAALEPTFGGINLEDIKAPDCFYVERKLRERMKIPVFHDDQHGTAITVGAAILNGLKVVGKDIRNVKLVTSGAGAAALACLGLLVKLGLPRKNIFVTDLAGVVYTGRKELMDEDKIQFAQETSARTLTEVIADADVFLGLSAGGVLKPDMVKKMAANPLILALANPNPEISPEDAKARAPTASWPRAAPTTTRSTTSWSSPTSSAGARLRRHHDHGGDGDRGGARARGTGAGRAERGGGAAPYAGQQLLRARVPDPKPFDPRLMIKIAPAVAKAAAESGVAARPVKDMDAYRDQLQSFVYASGTTMKPIFTMAKTAAKKKVAFCEGEEERVMRAAQIVVDERGPADADRPPEIIAERSRSSACACRRAATTTWSTSSRTTATATSGRPTTA